MSIVAVILNYNDYKTTIKCIKNIASYKLIDKIIIVDNCSTDSSFETLSNYESDKVHVIKTDKNGGYSYGNNFGIKYAIEKFNAEKIIISNPDVYFTEDIIVKMIDSFKIDNSIAVVAPKVINAFGREEMVAWKLPQWKDDIILSIEILSKLLGNPLRYEKCKLKNDINYVDVVPGSFFMISKQSLIDVDFFDEDTFLYCEERILAYKLKQKGYKIILRGDISFIHEHSVSINNAIKSIVSKYKILFASRKIYHKKYLKTNYIQDFIFQVACSLGIIEKVIIVKIKESNFYKK